MAAHDHSSDSIAGEEHPLRPAAITSSDLHYASATAIAWAIREGALSSVEVTTHLLQRVEKVNPAIHAIVTLLPESALARAQLADEARARGEFWGALHGVPCTVKDTFETAGIRTTAGAVELRDYIPRTNAPVVDRLVGAGAIIIGKTNTPAMGAGWQTANDVFGVTNNPWDLRRTPGGSSGGCAAAIAAGLSYLSIGSDLGGSIRIPAAFCGVYGHKPSFDRIPSQGHIPPLPGRPQSSSSLGVRGPLARSAADLQLALDVLDNTAPITGAGKSPAERIGRPTSISDYRLGFVLTDNLCPVSAEVRSVLEAAIRELTCAGAKLEAGWPSGLVVEEQFKLYQCLALSRKAFHAPSEIKARKLATLVAELTGQVPATTLAAFRKQLALAKRGQSAARQVWQAYFEEHDAFLLPATFGPAFPHSYAVPNGQRWLDTSSGPQPYSNLPFWASFATVAGLPATVAPIGLTEDKLPVGIQIIGPYFEDAVSINLAGRLADLLGGFRPPPLPGTSALEKL